ncbi:hypothetical protein QR97_27900 [Streptomyces sp. PBH53]|uniref:hypothetical protein n=1 Tax=Streptomyces sp. PBH53 TaxID=1577075 RepID=UPI00065588B5|nr:hypothetical protein [Streptomyces sp. PBH53]AKN71231.1 hypothetical protein QR97_16720 [Streptomyces sp. PBH53]AKN73074.1 hypothetical protein QR97_27900 [Streptomyces sp. PBH53]
MTASRVPAAVDALLDILRARPALAGVRIVDGPEPVNLTDKRRIHVGWSPFSDAAVSLQQDFNSAGARTRDEVFQIAGYVEVRSGDKDMKQRRDDAFALLGEVEQALRATDAAPEAPTLNGTVLWAQLTAGDLYQQQAKGSTAGLAFTVTCQARI